MIPRIDITPKGGKERIERDATPIEARRLAYLQCPGCGGVIEEKHKFEMNARGVYVVPGQRIEPDGRVIRDPPESTTVSANREKNREFLQNPALRGDFRAQTAS